jgi:hypothetical protein
MNGLIHNFEVYTGSFALMLKREPGHGIDVTWLPVSSLLRVGTCHTVRCQTSAFQCQILATPCTEYERLSSKSVNVWALIDVARRVAETTARSLGKSWRPLHLLLKRRLLGNVSDAGSTSCAGKYVNCI